ncbi:TPA: hypothetical protein HA265_02025 [Candidatus Woesearchaeota archaeon]|nr:hypothetical protein [Candidatus Woesearchaeota archaeon]
MVDEQVSGSDRPVEDAGPKVDGPGRRDFLKIAGAGAATALLAMYVGGSVSGCAGAKLFTLTGCCPRPKGIEGRLRVVTYNIANARGNHDDFFRDVPARKVRSNLDDMIDMLKSEKADVVCMNEADFNSARTKNIDQAKYIARGLCFNHVIEETIFGMPPLLQLGNAVVSRYPLALNGHHQYGRTFAQRVLHYFKSYVDFDVKLSTAGSKDLNFVHTHYDAERESTRMKETAQILRHLRAKKPPFVLLGDFNSGPGMPSFDRLLSSGLVHNPYVGIRSYPSDTPRESIDHILVSKGLGIADYHTVHIEASDHRPIVGTVLIYR